MNWKVISRNVGYALLVSALFMFLSILVSVFNGNDSALAALIISFTITFIVGVFPFIFVRKTPSITLKEGYVIITLSWLLSFVFGMLPYALWGGPFTLQNAWFESVSGFTTTGATILEDVEALPRSLLFWRSSTHFIGGLGVVVFLLLVIPNSSPVRLRLTNMELSSLSRGGYSSRPNKTVFIFASVYLGIWVLSFVSYIIAGMPVFEAVCHSMSVCATGGFSTRNASIASFDSYAIEAVTYVFMLLSSLHFGLVFLCIVGRSLKPFSNPVIKFYLLSLAVFSLLSGTSIKISSLGDISWGRAVWEGAFQTLSAASTTGFAIADNAHWPHFCNMLLLLMGIMCGCAGSTTGGIKADRILLLFKSVGCHVGRILHPSSVNEVRLSRRVLRDEDVYPHLLYIAVYFVALASSTVLCLALGLNPVNSLASSVTSLGNVGPAIGEMGLMGNFGGIPAMAKYILTLDMFLGRIEIYPVLAVVAMVFDRRAK